MSTSKSHAEEELPIASINESKAQREEMGEVEATIVEDDGYHTPTSPSHRILPLKKCPPAPRKPVSMKRKPFWDRKIYRVVHRIDECSGKIELILRVVTSDLGHDWSKKRKSKE